MHRNKCIYFRDIMKRIKHMEEKRKSKRNIYRLLATVLTGVGTMLVIVLFFTGVFSTTGSLTNFYSAPKALGRVWFIEWE